MRGDEFVRTVEAAEGVRGVFRLDLSTVEELVGIERSCVSSCGIRMENLGMMECASMDDVFAMICDGRFPRPSEVTMEMVDEAGVVVGHDVPAGMSGMFAGRDDVQWLSSGFVLFPRRVSDSDVRMVMKSGRLQVDLPDYVEARVFYPSMISAELINRIYGNDDQRLCSAVVGVNGLDPSSVPVTDMVEIPGAGGGHREPAAQDALDRGYLVCELLQVAQFPLADQDLHALVMVQMDVDRGVDETGVVMLYVRELVPDCGDGVIVDHDDGADHPLVLVLPLGLGERVAYQVPYRLRPANVSLLGDGFVELLEQLRLKRHTDAGHSVHGAWEFGSNHIKFPVYGMHIVIR